MFKLVWEYQGQLCGRHFDLWSDLEEFSRRLIMAGLVPYVPLDSPTPYDAGGEQ